MRYAPFAHRPIASHGVIRRANHRLKLYTIRHGEDPLDLDDYRDGLELALSELPVARPSEGRPGLGFVIVHRGRDLDYVVLAWWDRENELPVRVFVRDDGEWRPAGESESFCVWDLEVMAFERNAYVETVLGGKEGGSSAYLGQVLEAPGSPTVDEAIDD